MAATLVQVNAARTQFVDANGAPLVGGKVTTYLPGTSTPLSTYQDSGATILNENPITLDGIGSAAIWCGYAVRMIVRDEDGNQIYDQVAGGPLSFLQGGVPASLFVSSSLSVDSGAAFSTYITFLSANGLTGVIDIPFAILSNTTITGKAVNLVCQPSAYIKFGNGIVLTLANCTGTVTGLNTVGALSSTTQYATFKTGITDAFAGAVTYNDGTVDIDGTDFLHTLSGNIYSITPEGSFGTARTRNVVGAYITLDATKRFVIAVDGAWLPGDCQAATTPAFFLYDSGHNLIGPFDPQTTTQNGSITALISGASYMKVQIGSFLPAVGAIGLVSKYDLSKLTIYSLVNDLATLPVNVSPGDTAHINLSNCNGMDFIGGNATMMKCAPINMSTCTGSRIIGLSATYVLHGPTDNHGVGNAVESTDIDLRLGVQGGGLIGSRAFRMRCLGGVGMSDCKYRFNRGQGASWAVELLPSSSTAVNTFSDNDYRAEFCGASLATGIWILANNLLRTSPTGLYGLELPGATCNVDDNQIYWDALIWLGFGISISNGGSVTITGGQIEAPYIINHVGGAGPVSASNVAVSYGGGVIINRGGGCSLRNIASQYCRPIYPYGATASGGIYDIIVSDPTYAVEITNCSSINAAVPDVSIYGSADITVRGLDADAASFVKSEIIRVQYPAVAADLSFQGNVGTNVDASTPLIGIRGVMPASTTIDSRGNVKNGISSDLVAGSYTRANLTGASKLTGTIAAWVIGNLAAGAAATQAGVSLVGAAVGDRFSFGSSGSLVGAAVSINATADDTVTVVITNASSGAHDFGTQTLTLLCDKPN